LLSFCTEVIPYYYTLSFFASEAAGFVTGQRLVVDGGRSLFA
jgi:NAD(P)-dependent dehydrogenase (short-subunit alcohol dehydrogenase family)